MPASAFHAMTVRISGVKTVSGPQARKAAEWLTRLGMSPRVAGERVGQASAIKLTRSIMIKGMEALFAECFLAARWAASRTRFWPRRRRATRTSPGADGAATRWTG